MKFGRMEIPFGEEYRRFHQQRTDNPLLSYSAPALWGWDEGIEFFGATPSQKVEWILAVTDGDWDIANTMHDVALTGKLTVHPAPWALVSVSGHRSGTIGTPDNSAWSALYISGWWASPFGLDSEEPNYQDGRPVPDDPDMALDLNVGELDVILTSGRWGRLWFAGGMMGIRSHGDPRYDRDLAYGIAEGILRLGPLSPWLERFYLAARYSTLGTFDDEEGYLIQGMNEGYELGYNVDRVGITSVGLGMHLNQYITLKSEYSWYDFDVVEGVPGSLRSLGQAQNYFGIGATVGF
jgi:hypothetical protein